MPNSAQLQKEEQTKIDEAEALTEEELEEMLGSPEPP